MTRRRQCDFAPSFAPTLNMQNTLGYLQKCIEECNHLNTTCTFCPERGYKPGSSCQRESAGAVKSNRNFFFFSVDGKFHCVGGCLCVSGGAAGMWYVLMRG